MSFAESRNSSFPMTVGADGLALLGDFLKMGFTGKPRRLIEFFTADVIELDDVDVCLRAVRTFPAEKGKSTDLVVPSRLSLSGRVLLHPVFVALNPLTLVSRVLAPPLLAVLCHFLWVFLPPSAVVFCFGLRLRHDQPGFRENCGKCKGKKNVE